MIKDVIPDVWYVIEIPGNATFAMWVHTAIFVRTIVVFSVNRKKRVLSHVLRQMDHALPVHACRVILVVLVDLNATLTVLLVVPALLSVISKLEIVSTAVL